MPRNKTMKKWGNKFSCFAEKPSGIEEDKCRDRYQVVDRGAQPVEEFAGWDGQSKQIGIDPEPKAIEMRKPCQRQQHSVCLAANDTKPNQDNCDRIERRPEKKKWFVVVKGAQYFAGSELSFMREH